MKGTYSTQTIPYWPRDGQRRWDMEIVASANAGESYEWDEFVVLRLPDKPEEFYVAEGSGCSCNSLWDDVNSPYDLAGPYTLDRVMTLATAWSRSRGWHTNGSGAVVGADLAATIRRRGEAR